MEAGSGLDRFLRVFLASLTPLTLALKLNFF